MKYEGVVTTKLGNDINTDDIIRADILQESWERKFFAKHAFEKYDPEFMKRCEGQKNVVVAGKNFACGSSREQAVYAIKFNNVEFLIGEIDPKTGVAFPDIFYKNSLTNGFKVIPLDDVSKIKIGDKLSLDLENQKIYNLTQDTEYKFNLPEEDRKVMLDFDKLLRTVKKDLEKLLEEK